LGVCHDFTHLAISFCRAHNIPARYVFGYLPDMDVEPNPEPHGLRRVDGGLARRPLVDLRSAQQSPPQRPDGDRPRLGRLGRGNGNHIGAPKLESMVVWAQEVPA
jgi:hypothetical protein